MFQLVCHMLKLQAQDQLCDYLAENKFQGKKQTTI